MVSSKIGGGNGLRRGTREDESTHPAPDILWARHLTQLRRRCHPQNRWVSVADDDLVTELSENARRR